MRLISLAILACFLGGCGTGYYDEVYKRRTTDLDLASKFAVLFPGPTQVGEGGDAVVQLPKIFDHTYNRSSNYTSDANGVIDPDRLNPPFLNPFPGLLGTYEAFVKPASGEGLPEYLYMGVKELTPDGKVALMQELAGKLKPFSPDANWEDVQVNSPQGTPVLWKKIKVSMPQDFFPQGHGRDAKKTLPGVFEIWWYDAEGAALLLAWRSADEAATVNNFHNLAELTAGTIRREEKKAEPAADPEAAARANAAGGS
jgi:hypothetical protein